MIELFVRYFIVIVCAASDLIIGCHDQLLLYEEMRILCMILVSFSRQMYEDSLL